MEEVKIKEIAGRRIGKAILTQLGYIERFLINTDEGESWDLEYVVGDYRELIEVKIRRYLLHQFNWWMFEDNKRKSIRVKTYDECVNSIKQIQVFDDGCHLMDVTKICYCDDIDYFNRDANELWQSNDEGGYLKNHSGSKYVAADFGYSDWKFVEPTAFVEKIDSEFMLGYVNLIKI